MPNIIKTITGLFKNSLQPRINPNEKERKEREQETTQKTQERLYAEYILFRLWFFKKDTNGIYEFEPVNIRTEDNPYYIDAITYDMAETSEENASIFASTASNEKLMLRGWNKNVKRAFGNSTCYRTYELKRLIKELS